MNKYRIASSTIALTFAVSTVVGGSATMSVAATQVTEATPTLPSWATSAEQSDVVTADLEALKASGPTNLAPGQVAFISAAGTHLMEPTSDVEAKLDPTVIAACNIGLGDVVVREFETSRLGTVSLKCGDDSNGYVHIRQRHERDWQAWIDAAGGGALWDDFMAYATNASLVGPSEGYPRFVGSGKWCYTTPIIIRSPAGDDTFMPSVFVSEHNKTVITAYPTRTPSC